MRSSRNSIKLYFLTLILALVLSACDLGIGGVEDPDGDASLLKTIHPATLTALSAEAAEKITPAPDPLGIPWSALDGLELQFWYLWDLDEPGVGLNAIVDRFNLENEWGIHVNAVDQGFTQDPLDSIETAFEDGLVPDVMISDASTGARWYQAGILVDLEPYLTDPAAGLTARAQKDYYPGIFEPLYLPPDIRPGLPFTQSLQVIYYNQTLASDLGFAHAPGSLEELVDQLCDASQSGPEDQSGISGMILYPEAANIAGWVYAFQGDFLDGGSKTYQFSSQEILDVGEAWQELASNSCGSMISDYPNPMAREIEFSQFNSRGALMIMNSADFLDQVQIRNDQTGRPDDWGLLPFLGPDGTKAVSAQVQSGLIFKTSPEQQLAAWLFLKYLTSPEIQAEWIRYSFFYPTRKESLRYLRDFRTDYPDWAKGLPLLPYSRTEPLDPAWDLVKQALGDAFEELLTIDYPAPEEVMDMLDLTAEELVEFSD